LKPPGFISNLEHEILYPGFKVCFHKFNLYRYGEATRRLKQAGELRVKVLSARFADPEAAVAAAIGEGFQLRYGCAR
jgi:hypothetical protein